MGLLQDLLGNLGKKQDTKSDGGALSLDDAANLIGAIGGNKQDQKDLAERAKDVIPGTIDDSIINVAEEHLGLDKKTK